MCASAGARRACQRPRPRQRHDAGHHERRDRAPERDGADLRERVGLEQEAARGGALERVLLEPVQVARSGQPGALILESTPAMGHLRRGEPPRILKGSNSADVRTAVSVAGW